VTWDELPVVVTVAAAATIDEARELLACPVR
jgi:hypothetical protein